MFDLPDWSRLSPSVWFSSSFPHLSLSSPLSYLSNCLFTSLLICPHISSPPLHISTCISLHLCISTYFSHLRFSIIFPSCYIFPISVTPQPILYFNRYISASTSLSFRFVYLFFTSLIVFFSFSVLCSWHCSEKAVVWDGAMFGGRRLWPVSQ